MSMRNSSISLKKQSMLEAPESITFFHVKIELVFERNTSCKSEFSMCCSAPFVQRGLFS
jgi:hypothetical protein